MGAYTLLQDLTVSTNSTSVVLNDFGTITKDDFVKVVFSIKHSAATTAGISLFANTTTSPTDYHRQFLRGNGSTVSAARSNDINRVFFTNDTLNGVSIAYLKLSENDKFNIFANNGGDESSVAVNFSYVTSTTSFSSGIDTLTFTHSGSGITIASGSRIQIYRLDAVKEADITVTSNTTQVDISNLSIDKDSEYLLVSDWNQNGTANIFLNLFVNDNTTSNTYYAQGILGDGSSSSAVRVNRAQYIDDELGNSIAYTHIKLSNIGAYTAQSYNIKNIGTSSIIVRNWFVSSESENITSITKLNIVAAVANTIGTGSRFILYKLYE